MFGLNPQTECNVTEYIICSHFIVFFHLWFCGVCFHVTLNILSVIAVLIQYKLHIIAVKLFLVMSGPSFRKNILTLCMCRHHSEDKDSDGMPTSLLQGMHRQIYEARVSIRSMLELYGILIDLPKARQLTMYPFNIGTMNALPVDYIVPAGVLWGTTRDMMHWLLLCFPTLTDTKNRYAFTALFFVFKKVWNYCTFRLRWDSMLNFYMYML